jgi:hypothetical protein
VVELFLQMILTAFVDIHQLTGMVLSRFFLIVSIQLYNQIQRTYMKSPWNDVNVIYTIFAEIVSYNQKRNLSKWVKELFHLFLQLKTIFLWREKIGEEKSLDSIRWVWRIAIKSSFFASIVLPGKVFKICILLMINHLYVIMIR